MMSSDTGNQHVIELMLLRPMEPLFMPKGQNRVVFDIPYDYMAPEFQDCSNDMRQKHADEGCIHVKIKEVNPHPKDQFAFAMRLKRHEQLSDFFPEHQGLVADVIAVFDKATDFGDFLSLGAYARDNLNVSLFARAFSTAVLHRGDMQGMRMPSISSADPFKFFPGNVMSRVMEQANVMGPLMKPIDMPEETASNRDPEHRVAYFREDLGVNSHHWKWHLVYPNQGPMKMVAKDRRGELFFYMHQQLIARYNAERLSNQLGKVRRFNDFKEPIPEAYFPKMGDRVSLRNYPARHANSVLRDIDRKPEAFVFDIAKLDIWRSRIYEAIDTGSVKLKDGSLMNLTLETGIDVLGNLLESSILSVNQEYYGNLHAFGHIACGVIHDPDFAHLERFSVMGDVATACRDPFFYRWHAMVDDLCQSYKNTLPAYEKNELCFKNVTIMNVDVVEKGAKSGKKPLTLHTNWMKDYIDVANGLDFQAENKSVYLAVKHLQYKIFDYNIKYKNTGKPRYGTVRIFIAPKLDEDGKQMSFNHQRTSFIEMDKFTNYFESGTNSLKRSSRDSSVTVLPEDTFRAFKNPPKGPQNLTKQQESDYFCGCGWPNHMLVPKGTCEGMLFDLFVMISDFELDNVGQTTNDMKCGAPSYCGIRDNLFPDKRPMGFPFDRNVGVGLKKDDKKTVRDMAKECDNMSLSDIVVQFKDVTVTEPSMQEEINRKSKCSVKETDPNVEVPAPVHEYDPVNPSAGAKYFVDPSTGTGYFADPLTGVRYIADPCK